MQDYVKAILTNGAVWGAGLNLVNAMLFYFVPGFPKEIWIALTAFINAILGAVGIAVVVREVRKVRGTRSFLETLYKENN